MHRHTDCSFVNEFRWVSPLHYLNNGWQTLFVFGACCKQGRQLYTTTAPSACIPAPYFHLSVHSSNHIVVNLQENRVMFRSFIVLLRFSFDSPSYNKFWRCGARKYHFSFGQDYVLCGKQKDVGTYPRNWTLRTFVTLSHTHRTIQCYEYAGYDVVSTGK